MQLSQLERTGTLGKPHACRRCRQRILGDAVWQLCGLDRGDVFHPTRATVWHPGCAPRLPLGGPG